MNKNDLVNAIAEKSHFTKKDAATILDSFISVLSDTLEKGDSVQLIGFGSFEVKERAAREGRNPTTGETIKVAAHKVPVFKAGKNLKDAVNK